MTDPRPPQSVRHAARWMLLGVGLALVALLGLRGSDLYSAIAYEVQDPEIMTFTARAHATITKVPRAEEVASLEVLRLRHDSLPGSPVILVFRDRSGRTLARRPSSPDAVRTLLLLQRWRDEGFPAGHRP